MKLLTSIFLFLLLNLVCFSSSGVETSGKTDLDFTLQHNGRELNIEVDSTGHPHEMTIREVGQSSRWIAISQNDFGLLNAQVSEMKRITREYQEAGRYGRKNCRSDHFAWSENGKESFLCLDGLGPVDDNGPIRHEKLRKTQNIAREMIFFLQRSIAETETPVALMPPRQPLGTSLVQEQATTTSLTRESGNRALRGGRSRAKKKGRSRAKFRSLPAEPRR